jgi:uncharacterized membrane protein
MVHRKRHIVKTVSYRILSTAMGFIFMLTLTGNVQVSTAFSLVEILWKPVQYYVHERVWYRYVKYGLTK